MIISAILFSSLSSYVSATLTKNQQLRKASAIGNVKDVKYLLQNNADVNTKDDRGWRYNSCGVT